MRRTLAIATALLPLAVMTVAMASLQYHRGDAGIGDLIVLTVLLSPFLAVQAGVMGIFAFQAGRSIASVPKWGAIAAVWAVLCLGSGWIAVDANTLRGC